MLDLRLSTNDAASCIFGALDVPSHRRVHVHDFLTQHNPPQAFLQCGLQLGVDESCGGQATVDSERDDSSVATPELTACKSAEVCEQDKEPYLTVDVDM